MGDSRDLAKEEKMRAQDEVTQFISPEACSTTLGIWSCGETHTSGDMTSTHLGGNEDSMMQQWDLASV